MLPGGALGYGQSCQLGALVCCRYSRAGWVPVVHGDWPLTALFGAIGLPAAAALIRLLRDHHAEPDRIAGSKFLALRFQTLKRSWLKCGISAGTPPELKGMELRLQIKPYGFNLNRPLHTAAGVLQHRRGWVLRLEDSAGRLGWGEGVALGG